MQLLIEDRKLVRPLAVVAVTPEPKPERQLQDVRLVDGGNLAGSAVTLKTVFENLTEDFGVDVAADLCCYAPREALRIKSVPRKWNLVDEETGKLLQSFRT